MKKYIFMFILGCSSYDIISYMDYAPSFDLFDERGYQYESHVLNNIPGLSFACGVGFLANTIGEKGSKKNRMANGVALTTLFGFQAIVFIGILLNNTYYYSGSFNHYDYLCLRYDGPLTMWRLGCYYLGYKAAHGLQDLETEETSESPEC